MLGLWLCTGTANRAVLVSTRVSKMELLPCSTLFTLMRANFLVVPFE
jgi:hypothetical protein